MPPTIGEVVRRLRRGQRFSQKQVAERSAGKISANWIASLETGKVRYSNPHKLEILAAVLGTTVTEIYRQAGIVDMHPSSVSLEQQQILNEYDRLPPELKLAALNIIRDLSRAERVDRGVTALSEVDDLHAEKEKSA